MLKIDKIHKNEWCFSEPYDSRSSFEEFEVVLELMDAGKLEQSEKKLKHFIKKHPYHIDAWHHLSLIYAWQGFELEAYLAAREAVRIGVEALPTTFKWKSSKIEWGHLENRPFLRACHHLGLILHERKETEKAIEIFEKILSVCPNDNIGIRLYLPLLWFESNDIDSIISHCKKHNDTYMPEIAYNLPLALMMKGDFEAAESLIKEAIDNLPLVAKELLKKRHTKPKSNAFGGITLGGTDQAYEYWKNYGLFWKGKKEYLEFIKKIKV
ncbi:tetratricopeptide repeat protein [Desulforhopalus singaporensis]|uniref:Tetratricopeptide repeat-containing protein n=1 Tax=Desulforhopalus singaporensis TaxID=91360 RepID=A0A1H0U503_9BACT|nr:DUF3151 family protein [Desulforhopalus singaporensis]SDP61221.1 Protein of unknown function [Desulforhopalus singaporensis]